MKDARTFSVADKLRFLSMLAKMPTISAAAEACGILSETAYYHRRMDPEFAKRWAATGKDVRPHNKPADFGILGKDIVEPKQWPNDHGARREPVIDPNWNDRVVRRVGWCSCLHCGGWFFSPDVRRVRMHEDCDQPTF